MQYWTICDFSSYSPPHTIVHNYPQSYNFLCPSAPNSSLSFPPFTSNHYYQFGINLYFLRLPYKAPKTRWLKTGKIYCLTIPEAGSPKSRCQQSHAPSEIYRGESFLASTQLLVFAGNLRHSLACRCIAPILSSNHVLSVSVSLCMAFFLWHQSYWIRGPLHPRKTLTNYICRDPYF